MSSFQWRRVPKIEKYVMMETCPEKLCDKIVVSPCDCRVNSEGSTSSVEAATSYQNQLVLFREHQQNILGHVSGYREVHLPETSAQISFLKSVYCVRSL